MKKNGWQSEHNRRENDVSSPRRGHRRCKGIVRGGGGEFTECEHTRGDG